MKAPRIAAYVRVSTTKDQTTQNQVLDLNKFAEARGWQIMETFADEGVSGGKESRPALDRLMAAARKRKFDMIIVWRLDRLGRSLRHLILILDELRDLGISFVSYCESLDLSTAAGRMMYQIIGACAEYERMLGRERCLAGIRRARAEGKALGRPRKAVDVAEAQELRKRGYTLRQIAKALNVSLGTVWGLFKNPQAEAPLKPAFSYPRL